MFYLTVPSLNSQMASVLGLRDDGNRRMKRSCPHSCDESLVSSPVKQLKSDGFVAKLDVKHFEPQDVTIKVVGSDLIVSGRHSERLDESGYISRQFTRRYPLPEDIDLQEITSKLTIDGKLVIQAPLKRQTTVERVIPITIEGKENNIQKNVKKITEEQPKDVVNAA